MAISYLSAPPDRWRWRWLRTDPQLFERNARQLQTRRGREERERRGQSPNPHRPPARILAALAGPSVMCVAPESACVESQLKTHQSLPVLVCTNDERMVHPQGNWDVFRPTYVIVSLKFSQIPSVELGQSNSSGKCAISAFVFLTGDLHSALANWIPEYESACLRWIKPHHPD